MIRLDVQIKRCADVQMKAHLLIVFVFGLSAISCDNASETQNVKDSIHPTDVMPEEALILSDSAFHTHFTKNDSASLKKALDLYYQSLTIDPDNFVTLNNIWQLETRLSLFDDAINTSRKMLKQSNNDITCIGMVGTALDRTGDSAQARRYYLWSLQVSEEILDTMDISNTRWITVQMNKAMMHSMLGDQQAADEAYDYLSANVDSSMAEAVLQYKEKTRQDFLRMQKDVE